MSDKVKRTIWSEEEIKLLTKLYKQDGLCISELYPIFNKTYPQRTYIGTKVKISKLKLRHTKEQITQLKNRILSGEKNPMYGVESWNKGQTKHTNKSILIGAQKTSKTRKEMYKNNKLIKPIGKLNPMYGVKAWNNGKTKYTDSRIMAGVSKISKARKETWKNYTQKEKDKIISHLTSACLKARKDTKIEIIIQDILNNNNIKYIKNYRISCFVLDFYLPDYNLVIECQGDYWHANKKYFKKLNQIQKNNKKRDKKKRNFLLQNNYKFLFFWENYILKNKDNLYNVISKYLNDYQNKIVQ